MLGKVLLTLGLLFFGIIAMVLVVNFVGVGAGIEVIVLDENNDEPVSGALVSIYDQQGKLVAKRMTSSDGTVSFDVEGGNYQVETSLSGYTQAKKSVSIGGGEKADVKLTLKKQAVVPGCQEDWECTEWGECVQGLQARTCTDLNECGSKKQRPLLKRTCTQEPEGKCNTKEDCDLPKVKCSEIICDQGVCSYSYDIGCVDDDGCCPSGCVGKDSDCGGASTVECLEDSDCALAASCLVASCSNGFCSYSKQKQCVNGDGCCPDGCVKSTDSDCKEQACSRDIDCFDGSDCTLDECVNGECSWTNITTCSLTLDRCCPPGCDSDNDVDCASCDTASDCDDGDECTEDLCTGSPKHCEHSSISSCGISDGCCPRGCTADPDAWHYDPDCTEIVCVDNDDCDDGIDCTEDTCNFDTGECENEEITDCNDADGCCPDGCDYESDNDCTNSWDCQVDEDCASSGPCVDDYYCNEDKECVIVDKECGIDNDGCCPAMCFMPGVDPCEEDSDCCSN